MMAYKTTQKPAYQNPLRKHLTILLVVFIIPLLSWGQINDSIVGIIEPPETIDSISALPTTVNSDSISIDKDNINSQIAIKNWFTEDSVFINGNTYYWPEYNRKISLYNFYLKYKTPNYSPIIYNPTFIQDKFLPDTSSAKLNTFKCGELEKTFNKHYSHSDAIHDSLTIFNPMLVKFTWNEIPSPHRFLIEGKKLKKKSIQGTFATVNIAPTRKLGKPEKEVKHWIFSGEEVVQLSQNHETNWVKGGSNNITLLSDLRATANYKKRKIAWDNKGIHKLGFNNEKGEDIQINNDMIELTSKLGVNASKKWYYSAFFNFKTQFFNVRDNSNPDKYLSGFMSPAYITSALGMDFKKSKDFTVLVSPITSKITTVLDTTHVDPSRYKVPIGKKATTRSGASVNSHLNWKISSNFRLEYNFDLFYGYLNKDQETQLDCEIIFNMKVNRSLSTRINGNFRYYENESDKLQFKENFSIAFSYRF